MNYTLRFTPTRRSHPLLLGCALVAACAATPAAAQQVPWVGFTPYDVQGHFEGGAGHPLFSDHFGSALAAGDFDADGTADLAAGIPGNDCSFEDPDCGSVQVQLGSSTNPLGAVLTLDPAHPDAPDPAHFNDLYGSALVVGDFNADGHDDLAVGIPGNRRTPNSSQEHGAVQIHYGLPAAFGSLQRPAGQILQEVNGMPPPPPDGSYADLGAALAAGDFNGDGHDDLAIGYPRGSIETGFNPGRVYVAGGHDAGLVPYEGFAMQQGAEGLPDVNEHGDAFGKALAAGDFNGDSFDDLAIGVPGEDDGIGAVLVVYGSEFSLLFSVHWYIVQGEIGGDVQAGEGFGESLATGDLDGDGFDELVIGASRHDAAPGVADAGEVAVVFGSETGLSPARALWLAEDTLLSSSSREAFDRFGSAFAVGDFDGDRALDLAIGMMGDNHSEIDAGAAVLVSGLWFRQPGRPDVPPRKLFPGEAPNLLGLVPHEGTGQPLFGAALAAGDFDGNGFADLVLGAPFADRPAAADAGSLTVLYGRFFTDGFESSDASRWSSTAP